MPTSEPTEPTVGATADRSNPPQHVTAQETSPPEAYRLSPETRRVFIGLMLGMLVASLSQTIVGPALPRIFA